MILPRVRAVALLDLMRAAHFTEQEFALLAQAKALSDTLTHTEREAMRLRQEQGSPAEASAMLHDTAYLSAKAAIMAPIEGFHALVLRSTHQDTVEQEIIDWCRANMAAYKAPRTVQIVDALPKSGSGKVMWRALQEADTSAS